MLSTGKRVLEVTRKVEVLEIMRKVDGEWTKSNREDGTETHTGGEKKQKPEGKAESEREVEEERVYCYWLCHLPGVGKHTIGKLLQICGNARNIYTAPDEVWEQVGKKGIIQTVKQHKEQWDLEGEYRRMCNAGIRFLLQGDAAYPGRLKNIPDAPFAIFAKGKVPEDERVSVAVIGARDCSEYGSYVAAALGKTLGENGVQVISGMARGIDGISQKAALGAGGNSFGVLGCGVDICYPKQNQNLYVQLLEKGGILSAYVPGTLPRAQNFPPRNRIVSGLADVVVVVEARQKSGTLITVDMALEQGKEVYVVPGRVTDRLSDGCNRLVKQGAEIFLSPADFLEELRNLQSTKMLRQNLLAGAETGAMTGVETKSGMGTRTRAEAKTGTGTKPRTAIKTEPGSGAERKIGTEIGMETGERLPSQLLQIYQILDFTPMSVEQILHKLQGKYTVMTLNPLLMQLCMEKYAVQVSPGYYCRR